MACISVALSGCEVKSNGETMHLPDANAFSAFEYLFRPGPSPPPHHSEAEGRAKKRRKLPEGYQAIVEHPFDASNSALLAEITLDFVPYKSQALPSLANNAQSSVALHLSSFRRNENQMTLSMVDTVTSVTVQFDATVQSEVIESLATHLETAASVGAEWDKSSASSRNDYIPFCRCVLSAPTSVRDAPQLKVELRWPYGTSVVGTWRARLQQRANFKILSTYFPIAVDEAKSPWTLSDFYDAVHVPSNCDTSPRIGSSLPSTKLYPYQQRSVDWMLRREGVTFSSTGELQKFAQPVTDAAPISFSATQDNAGTKCYVSHIRGMLIPNMSSDWDSTGLHGGILAEEMGLGKSVELISLMCLHKREITEPDVFDAYLAKTVKASGATLIITPPAILEQWISEINRHAPHLKCLHYKGLTRHTLEEATPAHLLQFDIVLTSYDVLSKEIHHATPPPDRSLRHAKVHKHRSSPLVEISWWRVCLDEAQMVEGGVSQAATMARIIPRCNAWAVSGTPLRNNVTDLAGLLVFLRCEPYASTKGLFARLDKPSFRTLIGRLALRHTKDQIRDDLDIPPQKRVVITVPFTAIEDEYYKDMFRQMCEACFLSPDGTPTREDRTIDHPDTIERMREWLVRLRQTCLHSHVGEKNRKAMGPKRQPLRTVQEVLQVMIDQNDTRLKTEAREMILAQMRRGHIYSFAQDIASQKEQAISYYREALQTTLEYVKLGREEIAAETEKLRLIDPDAPVNDDYEGDDDKDETIAKYARLTTLRRSLRSFLELEHACNFFIGNMYYQWKEDIALTVPDSAEYDQRQNSEKEWYDKAQAIRQELLKDTETRTQRQMSKVGASRDRYQDMELPDVEDLGGIESRNVLEQLDRVTEIINLQSAKLKEWRNKIIEILTMSLVDNEGKETTGEEYDASLTAQDELYIYIQAFRTIAADMTTAIHGTQDLLVNNEMDRAIKQARDEDPAKRGHAPELLLRLARERTQLRSKPEHGSLKGVVGNARQMVTQLQHRSDMEDRRATTELAIAQRYLTQIQEMFIKKTELMTELEKEQEQFRLTMNLRLEFYRQIQHLSETVEDYKDEMDETFDLQAFALQSAQIGSKQTKIQRFKVKQTYLNTLRDRALEPQQHCNICLDPYERGVLTTCGHKYCRPCILTWWKINHTCPECRTTLARADMKEITHNTTAITAQEENNDAAAAPSPASSLSSGLSIYSSIHNSTMNEIKTVRLEDSYGSKVDMMARHLLWIRNNDPGAKTIIYSQFADFLQVLRLALRRFKIGVSGIRDKNGIEKFKKDPAVECFLLDAKSNSSGLNLVNATYVFLCEPLINPALELQAIARVHRIGQKRPTTVFMYIVGNTVEEAIYDISVKRRLEHMGRATPSRSGTATPAATERAQERDFDLANSEAIKTASLSKLVREGNQGEVVVADDLWKCLFGKPRNITANDEPAAMTDEERRRHELRVRREQFLQQVEAPNEDAQIVAAAAVAIENGDLEEIPDLARRVREHSETPTVLPTRSGGDVGAADA